MRYRRLAVVAAAMLGLPFATLTPASASTTPCASPGGTTIADCGFESPDVGSGNLAYKYNPSGSAWAFTGNSGISGNGSDFTYSQGAPEGRQVAFLQSSDNGISDGNMSQSISGWDGTTLYTLVLSEANRLTGDCGNLCSEGGLSSYEVLLDGAAIAPPTQVTSTTYTDYKYTFVVPSGTHTLSLAALPGTTHDTTTFIDNLRLSRTYTATNCKDGGWQTIGTYKNQGDCVSFYATGGRNTTR
jgi:hypothetical protein